MGRVAGGGRPARPHDRLQLPGPGRRRSGQGDRVPQAPAGEGVIMSPETFVATIATYRDRRPFRPFTVELVSGRRVEIDHPEAILVREGTAAALLPGGVPVIFDWEGTAA